MRRILWCVPVLSVAGLVALFSPQFAAWREAPDAEPPPPMTPTAAAAPRVATPADAPATPPPAANPTARLAPNPPVEPSAPNRAPAGSASSGTARGANVELEPLDCVIQPFEVIEISSPVVGRIHSVLVERSELVERDQVVVKLESSVEWASVRLARARSKMDGDIRLGEASLALGRRKQERARKLFKNNALSLDLRDEVDTEARLAELELKKAVENQRLAALELDQALAALSRRTIHSPISGVVVERLKARGEVVDDETILRIAKIDPLRVEVILPAALYGSVSPGMRAAVEPEFPGDVVHVANVTLVDRVIDAASGTFGVRLELPNADHAIPGGLHCQIRFLAE